VRFTDIVSIGCLEQVEKLTEHPPLAELLEKLKSEY
jgi:hypothetical protein